MYKISLLLVEKQLRRYLRTVPGNLGINAARRELIWQRSKNIDFFVLFVTL
jgi:hypothetical protein